MKKLFILIVLIGVAYLGLTMSGYAFYPKNFKYYIPKPAGQNLAEVTFHNGTTFSGEITLDAVDSIQLNMDGSKMTFKKSEISSIKETQSNFITSYIENVKRQSKSRPLIAKDKAKAAKKAAGKAEDSGAGFLKQITQVDKLEQFQEVKEKLGKIDEMAKERNAQIENLMNNGLNS